MNAIPSPAPSAAPAALAAFLRGVERRGAVLAELQCGDAGTGDACLGAAMHRFRAVADGLPMSEWPREFWAGLLADPALRQQVTVALPLQVTDSLAELGHGPRAAVLLHLAAGLSEETAAAALSVSVTGFRLALQRAMPRHDDGRTNAQAWQRLREHIQHRIKTLPNDRLARLAMARDAVLGRSASRLSVVPASSTPAAAAQAGAEAPRHRWLLGLLRLLLVLVALAFAATWYPPVGLWIAQQTADPVRHQALPPAAPPAARYGGDTAMITHRDFALLADPEGVAAARELDFHSWLAAQGDTPASASGAMVSEEPVEALPSQTVVADAGP